MSESESKIRGPDRVWVRVCRVGGVDVVDQLTPEGEWQPHARSALAKTVGVGTWRRYVREDIVPEQAPRVDLPDGIDWPLVVAVLRDRHIDGEYSDPVEALIARRCLQAAMQIEEARGG